MAKPQHQFQQLHQQHQQQSKHFGNLYSIDGQISPPVAYLNGPNFADQSQHPPTGGDGGIGLQWNGGLEQKKRRLKEQDFLENNSQISSVDFLQPRSVSAGLGLSLDNGRLASSGDSPYLALIRDDVECELQRQDAEIDRYIKVQVWHSI